MIFGPNDVWDPDLVEDRRGAPAPSAAPVVTTTTVTSTPVAPLTAAPTAAAASAPAAASAAPVSVQDWVAVAGVALSAVSIVVSVVRVVMEQRKTT